MQINIASSRTIPSRKLSLVLSFSSINMPTRQASHFPTHFEYTYKVQNPIFVRPHKHFLELYVYSYIRARVRILKFYSLVWDMFESSGQLGHRIRTMLDIRDIVQCSKTRKKNAISKVQKHIICIFKNGKKSIFAFEKSLKLNFWQF